MLTVDRPHILACCLAAATALTIPLFPTHSSLSATEAGAPDDGASALGSHVVLSWNDLGMHCMNGSHRYLSVLPPYNTLHAQVVFRGDASQLPQVVTSGVTVEYSIPGNSYSVGKTDFWTYAPALFGVNLPPNTGLTGLGLTGQLSVSGSQFVAEGIPVTPFRDAQPSQEYPYQQALVIARDPGGAEMARSSPVIPVSIEMSCVSAGCHASETAILLEHELVPGFNPANTPILCASCHGDPALGTPGDPEAGYFSFRMHDQHKFLDEEMTGTALCYKCHPGDLALCLRGVMRHRFGMVCQDCHGGMIEVASSIEQGRAPWVQEPACRDCHTERFGEPVGQLYRNSAGHGGIGCPACHGSPHAEYTSQIAPDNANMIALQGFSGILTDCSVCHGMTPAGLGPHDITVAGFIEEEMLAGRAALAVYPNPTRRSCRIEMKNAGDIEGTVLVFDAQGRTVRLIRVPGGTGEVTWDGLDGSGSSAAPGVYFVRWREGEREAAAKVLLLP
jgi:hypothetical protein